MELNDFIIAVFCIVDEAESHFTGCRGSAGATSAAASEVITMEVICEHLALEQESTRFARV